MTFFWSGTPGSKRSGYDHTESLRLNKQPLGRPSRGNRTHHRCLHPSSVEGFGARYRDSRPDDDGRGDSRHSVYGCTCRGLGPRLVRCRWAPFTFELELATRRGSTAKGPGEPHAGDSHRGPPVQGRRSRRSKSLSRLTQGASAGLGGEFELMTRQVTDKEGRCRIEFPRVLPREIYTATRMDSSARSTGTVAGRGGYRQAASTRPSIRILLSRLSPSASRPRATYQRPPGCLKWKPGMPRSTRSSRRDPDLPASFMAPMEARWPAPRSSFRPAP